MTQSIALLVRVQTVRDQNSRGFGGAIFTGVPIDETGQVTDAKEYYVIKATSAHLADVTVEVGQWWQVEGKCEPYVRERNGFLVTEKQFAGELHRLAMRRPTGKHIVTLLAEGGFFRIGPTKAQRLWDRFGDDLYGILDGKDVARLTENRTLTKEIAERLVADWERQGDSQTLIWLAQNRFDVKLGRKLLRHFGSQTRARIEEDPYRLLSFCAGWNETDRLAREHFQIAEDDPRRLQAAIEETVYRIFHDGHTCASFNMLKSKVQSLLAAGAKRTDWTGLVERTLKLGLINGSYVISENHNVHPVGPLLMERTVASGIARRIPDRDGATLLDPAAIDALIARYEAEHETPGFKLNQEQREAVQVAGSNRFSIITGGAGAGKTTVLEVLYWIYDQAGVRLHQAALAGKAAKRMEEATGRRSSTIHTFLKSVDESSLEGPTAVVLDECSMLDIWTLYQVISLLPAHVRLVMVGDPEQLMPVGPGLTLHALVRVAGVPLVELKKVNRYGGMIAEAAGAVREGRWLDLPADPSLEIAFVACDDDQLADTVVKLYGRDPDNTQVLSSTKNGTAGTRMVNEACANRFAAGAPEVIAWTTEDRTMLSRTGLRLGEPVICTRNIYERGLRNGSLGRITKVEPEPKRPGVDDEGNRVDSPIAWVEWDDGETRPLYESMLDDIQQAYAITIHKAQGSQWQRVIVPVPKAHRAPDGSLRLGRILDRTLIYTAMTRARSQVLFVGDLETVKAAVNARPKSARRHVALDIILHACLTKGGQP